MRKRNTYSRPAVETLLYLVRIAMGNAKSDDPAAESIGALTIGDWEQVRRMADDQGVSAIALDGIDALYSADPKPAISCDPDQWTDFLMRWALDQAQIEKQYQSYKETLARLALLYQQQGIRMMVLKGYGLSLNYPKPQHRPTGDLDIYLFGRQEEGDRLLAEQGIAIDKSHHHHTTFRFEEVYVENHYDIVEIYSHRGARELDEELKRLTDRWKPDKEMPNVCYPSDEFNTLFLLRHMGGHFAADRMTLRQLLDWALSPKAELADGHKMDDYLQIVNTICNHCIGFDLPAAPVDSAMERRVLDDIISPYAQDRLTPVFRLKRWFANRWKIKLFHQSNLFVTFLTQLRSHLTRPLGHAHPAHP